MFDLEEFAKGCVNAIWMFVISVIVVGHGLAFYETYNDDAMKVCQISHSHDVCFDALNR